MAWVLCSSSLDLLRPIFLLVYEAFIRCQSPDSDEIVVDFSELVTKVLFPALN